MKTNTIISNIVNPKFNTIIFDLNGTITNSISTNPKHILFRNNYIENKIKAPIKRKLPKATTKALEIYGLNPNDYYKYRNNNIDWNLFNTYSETIYNSLLELTNLGYNLVLYTDCFLSQVNPTLAIIKSQNLFKLIVSKELGYRKPNIKAYQFIAKELDVNINELLMIANDWKQDLEPLNTIGGNTIWIKSKKYIVDAKNIIINMKSNEYEINSMNDLQENIY